MQRDMDLFREILLQCETHNHGYAPKVIDVPDYSKEQIDFHIYLLGEAGLLRTINTTSLSDKSPKAEALNITNDGYDFIEKTRDPDTWQKTKKVVAEVGVWTLPILISVATDIIKQKVSSLVG